MKNHLLLLHGALGSKEQFNELKQQLYPFFKIYTLDFQGHGNTTSEADFSTNLFTDNVIAFLANAQLEKVHIFGYSMGGYVALNLARKQPSLVGKIMTLGTKFDWTPEIAAKEIKMLNPDKIAAKVPAFAKHLKQIHPANNWKEVVRKTADMMHGLGNGKRLTAQDLSKIKHHTLIGIGGKDHMVSITESTEAFRKLPNAELRIIEDFKHPIEKVNQETLATVIKEFLRNED